MTVLVQFKYQLIYEIFFFYLVKNCFNAKKCSESINAVVSLIISIIFITLH